MKFCFKKTLLASVAGSLTLLAACDGNHPGLVYAEPSLLEGTLTFDQNLESQDLEDSIAFPGQANQWDLTTAFEIADGSDDQFDDALSLSVGEEDFPSDQVYSELSWFGPDFTVDDGIVAAAVADEDYYDDLYNGESSGVIDGDYSAYLKGLAQSALQQTVALSGAVNSVEFNWSDDIDSCAWDFNDSDDIEDVEPYEYRVVVRDESGNELEELYSHTDTDDETGDDHFADLTEYAGDTVVISFERQNGNGNGTGFCTTVIDNVSIIDDGGSGDEFVDNGDFEEGDLTGWTQSGVSPQNVRSGSRDVGGLNVTRSFFARPGNLWGRATDEFVNLGSEPVETTITYATELGNDYYGIIYLTPESGDRAFTSWDGEDVSGGDSSDRDLAVIFGDGAETVEFLSATVLDTGNGDDMITYSFPVTVQPGEQITIVHFVVLSVVDTDAKDGRTIDTLADETDAEVQRILGLIDGRMIGEVAEGMTRRQLETVVNFSMAPY